MAKNCGKIVLLLIPCLATTCLLTYCLLSDGWVNVDSARLKNVTELYESQFEAFNYSLFSTTSPKRVVLQSDRVSKSTTPSLSSSTLSSTTVTVTTKSTPNDVHGVDYTDEEYTDEGASDTNYVKRQLKRNVKNENLFNSKLSNNERHFKAKDEDVDVEEEEEAESESEADQVKHKTENTMDENAKLETGGNNNNRIDFIYVTMLWPFVKTKSLYSDCIEYNKLNLKISVSYLTMNKKEPIIGQIHYYDNAAYFSDENKLNAASCNKKSMIFCRFTKTCKHGKSCDGVVDCEDQSDEQNCNDERVCSFNNDITGFKCDNKCWQYWNKCDFTPNCFDLSDETSSECEQQQQQQQQQHQPHHQQQEIINSNLTAAKKVESFTSSAFSFFNHDHSTFTFGRNHFDRKRNCFRHYFNFKSAKLIKKDTLKYLSQQLADNVQETNNINYHLQLIYTLSFLASLLFCLLALISIAFIVCFGKLCFQCPFWFFGFFQILAWLTCLSGLMTFIYQFFSNKQKSMDPLVQLPIYSEVMRLNRQLLDIERLGLTFWFACAATVTSFVGSFMSCIICCRLPSSRHEDKEYKIMQLPTYS